MELTLQPKAQHRSLNGAFISAAMQGNEALLIRILAQGDRSLLDFPAALMISAERGHPHIATALLHAEPSLINSTGSAALRLARMSSTSVADILRNSIQRHAPLNTALLFAHTYVVTGKEMAASPEHVGG